MEIFILVLVIQPKSKPKNLENNSQNSNNDSNSGQTRNNNFQPKQFHNSSQYRHKANNNYCGQSDKNCRRFDTRLKDKDISITITLDIRTLIILAITTRVKSPLTQRKLKIFSNKK